MDDDENAAIVKAIESSGDEIVQAIEALGNKIESAIEDAAATIQAGVDASVDTSTLEKLLERIAVALEARK